jgi:hypothetical protein
VVFRSWQDFGKNIAPPPSAASFFFQRIRVRERKARPSQAQQKAGETPLALGTTGKAWNRSLVEKGLDPGLKKEKIYSHYQY